MTQVSELTSDLPTITAEINTYKRVAGEAIFEIGRRLKHVKENDLAHGQWEQWLREEVDIHPRVAQMHMKVAETPSLKTRTSSQMGLDALYLIATLPPEERTREHSLKSGESKTVDEMTVRELREVKAALKAEKEARSKAETDYELVRDTLSAMRDQAPQIEYVDVPDRSAEERLRRYEEKYGDIDAEVENYATNTQDLTATVMMFSRGVREFTKRYSYIAQYAVNISALDGITSAEYTVALEALRELVSSFPEISRRDRRIIDIA